MGHTPCKGLSVRCIDTDDLLKVAIALGELSVLGGRGHVVCAADEIIPVLAVVGTSDGVITRLEAELVAPDECVPVEDLGEGMATGFSGTV